MTIAKSANAVAKITAAQVFPNRAAVWNFRDGYGHTMTIEVAPQPDGSSIWHFTKDNASAYWQPGTDKAELWFTLVNTPMGWVSTASKMKFPAGCWFCNGFTEAEQTVNQSPGSYLIIPANDLTSSDTVYTSHWKLNNGTEFDTRVAWKTDAGTEQIGGQTALRSTQREGCNSAGGDTAPECYFEDWSFIDGPEKIAPHNQGRGGTVDPLLTMVRIH